MPKEQPKTTSIHFSSSSDDWPTPAEFFGRLAEEFGGFTLDVCADAKNHKAENWYGLDHPDPARRNALFCDWVADAGGGNIWMNPPYGDPMAYFMRKAVQSAAAGATVVTLVPARTDTQWFHTSTFESDVPWELRFVKARLKFGDARNSAPFPSAVIVFGPGAKPCGLSAMPAVAPAFDGQMDLFDPAA